MRILTAAPWYGPDQLILTYTGMMEAAAKVGLYLAHQISIDNPGVMFDVMGMDDPLQKTDKRTQVYFHGDGAEMICYIVKWRSLARGKASNMRRDAADLMRGHILSSVRSKFPAQAAALKNSCAVVTSNDRDWATAVPPVLRRTPENPRGRSTIGLCLVFRNFEPWPEDLVKRLTDGGIGFQPPNSQSGVDFDTEWNGAVYADETWLVEGYYTPAEIYDDDGTYINEEREMILVHCLVTRDPDNPEDSFGILGIDADSETIVGLWVEGDAIESEYVGETAVRNSLIDDEDPLPFKTEHIDAFKKALALARSRGKSIESPAVGRIISDVAGRTTSTIVWPSVNEVRSMIPRAAKLFRGNPA